jgi:choline dehydrogenase-like flavoprotein
VAGFAGAGSGFRLQDRRVVDVAMQPQGLRGIDGVRIADAAVVAVIPAGNTNATVCAIAERAAQLVLEADRPGPGAAQNVEPHRGRHLLLWIARFLEEIRRGR